MRLTQKLKERVLKQDVLNTLSVYDTPQQEIVFNTIMPTKRRFRADYYCPNLKLIIELNGGQWVNGRHNRGGKGYENDLTKINMAQRNGFQVWQYTYEMIERGELKQDLEQCIKSRKK